MARVTIDPRLGGRVVSFRDQRGQELVEQGRPPASGIRLGDPFVTGGLGGFDDCLPGIAAERLGGPGIRSVADHGDVWSRPARVEHLTPTSTSLSQRGSAGDYGLRRAFTLEGATLRVDYTLANRATPALRAVWAAHPLLPLTSDAELDLGPIEHVRIYGGTMGPPGLEVDPRHVALDGQIVDVTRPGTVPPGHCLKAFAPLPGGAEVGVAYPARGVGLRLRLTAERAAWLGVWVNALAFPPESPVSHLALEPSFGDSDALGEAIADGSDLVVAPGAAFEWSLEYEIRPEPRPGARRPRHPTMHADIR